LQNVEQRYEDYFRAARVRGKVTVREREDQAEPIRAASAYVFFKDSYTLFLYTTLYIVYSVLLGALYIFVLKTTCKTQAGKLTLYPDPAKRTELSLIVGELHHPRTQMSSETPHRLVIPKRGLFTGIAGLTSGVVILTWQT